MKKLFLIYLMITSGLILKSQDSISLQQLLDHTIENATISKTNNYYNRNLEVQKLVLKKANLPQIKLNAQATYQSDVTEIELDGLPFEIDMPTPDKDQYKVVLEVNQKIYDGGISKNNILAEEQLNIINQQGIEIEQLRLKSQVVMIYFSILKTDRQIESLYLFHHDLEEKGKAIEAGIRNGIFTKGELYHMEAEILNLEQSIKEMKIQRTSLIKYLSALTKHKITDDTGFSVPVTTESENGLNRPELMLFDQQKDLLSVNGALLKSTMNPQLYAFGQLGYGRPGLNFLSTEFMEYYIVGAGFNWYLWDWKQNRYKREVLQVQKNILDVKKEDQQEKLEMSLINKKAEIEKIRVRLTTDRKIIDLREKTAKQAEAELKEGVITSTDYIMEKSKEIQAKLSFELHQIELQEAIFNLNIESGNF